MEIGGVFIIVHEKEGLELRKKKPNFLWALLFNSLLIALSIWFVYYLITRKEFVPSTDPFTIIISLIILLSITGTFIYNIYRETKNYTNYLISITEELVIVNGENFCRVNELNAVVIRRINGWRGLGESYTLGLASKKKFFPLCFNQNLENATAIASIVAHYLEKEVFIKEGSLFFSDF